MDFVLRVQPAPLSHIGHALDRSVDRPGRAMAVRLAALSCFVDVCLHIDAGFGIMEEDSFANRLVGKRLRGERTIDEKRAQPFGDFVETAYALRLQGAGKVVGETIK